MNPATANLEVLDDAPIIEHRSKLRYHLPLDLTYQCATDGQLTGTGKILNISSAGVRFTSQHYLSPASVVMLTVDWPARIRGTVPLKLVLICIVVRASANDAAATVRRHEFRIAPHG